MSEEKTALEKRLHPDHLVPEIPEVPDNTDALKEEIESEMDEKTKKEDPAMEDDPRSKREYPFELNWTDGRGKVWKGKFLNQVLDIRTQAKRGIMRARLSAGLPMEALDALTVEINLMVAHLSFSLLERPTWANDLMSLNDVELLQEIYQEVALHEAIFLGRG